MSPCLLVHSFACLLVHSSSYLSLIHHRSDQRQQSARGRTRGSTRAGGGRMAKKVLFPDDNKYWQHDFFAPLTADPDSDLSDCGATAVQEKMHPVSIECASCSKQVKWESAYPESDSDFDDETHIKTLCSTCWDNHVKQKLLPKIRERRARGRDADPVPKPKSGGKKKGGKKKGDKKTNAAKVPKKKRRRRDRCKCGSTAHKSARSLQCPRNPKSRFYRGPGRNITLTLILTLTPI